MTILTTSCANSVISSHEAFCSLYLPVTLSDAVIAVADRVTKERVLTNNRTYIRLNCNKKET